MPAVRVLVIEDEDAVREATAMMVAEVGYEVFAAASGEEGVQVFEQRGDIDVVLVDLTMPGIDGIATLERIRQVRRGVPIVLMSGYATEDVLRRVEGGCSTMFLAKPFRLETLEAALAESLGRPGGDTLEVRA